MSYFRQKQNKKSITIDTKPILYGAASFCSSFIVQLMHPFDVIKTRLQSHDGGVGKNIVPKYNNIRNAIQTMYKQEGLTGFYKGFAWTFIANSLSRMLFFTMYETFKKNYQKSKITNINNNSIFLASSQAGIITTLITTPLWILKTRMLLNTNKNISGIRSLINSSVCIYRDHGLRGFWRGLIVSLPLCLHGVIQMYSFETLMKITKEVNSQDINGLNALFAGFISKIVAILSTYPLSTLRTRIQQNQYFPDDWQNGKRVPKYINIRDIIKKMIKYEGGTSFYKGVQASLIMNVPSNAIYFFFYELFKNSFNNSAYKP